MDICLTDQKQFIQSAFHFHKRKAEYLVFATYREDIVEWLYKLGRDYNVLQMDYAEFKEIICGRHKNYSYWDNIRYYHRIGYSSYHGNRSHYCRIEEYRVLKGFTYSGQTKKNSPSKNDWWEHKGFARSRRRASGFQRGWKRSLKHFNKRKHRAMERDAIKNERYDDLHCQTWKIEDAWSWD